MSTITLKNDRGDSLLLWHSRTEAHTVLYELNNGTRYKMDVRERVANGNTTTVGGTSREVFFVFRSKIGTEIWDGAVRISNSKYQVSAVACGTWEQTSGRDADWRAYQP